MALDWLAILLLNVDYLVIGRFLGAEALGIYTVAFRIPELVILQLCVVVARVVFPVYTRVRDDPEALRNGFLTTMRYVALITVPLGLGLMLVAEPFVLTMFTAKWAEAIPVMRAIALYALLVSISFNAGDIYKARGYLGIMIKLTLLELAILCGGLYLAITGPGTTAAVAWVHVVVALVGKTVNIAIACRIIDTPFNQVLVALRPAALAGVVMMPVVLVALSLTASAAPLVQLVAGITAGALAYGGVLWLFQRNLMMEASKTLRAAFLKKHTG
jgi:PST family polysaccharide transporter